MSLDLLEKHDQKAAAGILAAAALASAANVSGDEPAIAQTYKVEAQQLLAEVRKRLHIDQHDNSSAAAFCVSNFLVKQLEETLLGETDISKILARSGQAGRLPPVMYSVDQPKVFGNIFYKLGVRRNHVDDAVRHPNDYQHLMTEKALENDKNVISLFMQEVKSAKKDNDHWLLVQCFRRGLVQVAQSAWRIFPDTVDLSNASQPLDVLKSFVAIFGFKVRVGEITSTFIESVPYIKKNDKLNWEFQGAANDSFASISFVQTSDPEMLEVGIGYSINMPKYRHYLAIHSVL